MANPDEFDCHRCEVGFLDYCAMRADEGLRSYRAAVWRRRRSVPIISDDYVRTIEEVARVTIASQQLLVPASTIWAYLPAHLRVRFNTADVAGVLRFSSEFKDHGDAMFEVRASPDLDANNDTVVNAVRPTDSGILLENLLHSAEPLDRMRQMQQLIRWKALAYALRAGGNRQDRIDQLAQEVEIVLGRVRLRDGIGLAQINRRALGLDQSPVRPETEAVPDELLPIAAYELASGRDEADISQDLAATRQELVLRNLRLVAKIAQQSGTVSGFGFLDRVSEGVFGLLKAIDGFDPYRGYQFSTYATWWIRQTVTRAAADTGRLIRLPAHVSERLARLASIDRESSVEPDSPTTHMERAVALGDREGTEVDERRIRQLDMVGADAVPLTAIPVHDPEGEDLTYLDILWDQDSGDQFDDVSKRMLSDRLSALLKGLEPRQARVIQMRFGFPDGSAMTLEEIGKEFGLTRERIRQIEAKALGRLRHHSRTKYLRGELGEADFATAPVSDEEEQPVKRRRRPGSVR